MKINIDLNRLSTEELKSVAELKDKYEEKPLVCLKESIKPKRIYRKKHKHHKWTKSEVMAIVQDVKSGLNIAKIARKQGYRYSQVNGMLWRLEHDTLGEIGKEVKKQLSNEVNVGGVKLPKKYSFMG